MRGHFERGGQTLCGGVDATVERVIQLRTLDPEATEARRDYVLFGGNGEAFLAHQIVAPPDFDQVLAVAVPDGIDEATLARGVAVRIAEDDVAVPLIAGTAIEADIGGARLTLEIADQLYLEWGDLAD